MIKIVNENWMPCFNNFVYLLKSDFIDYMRDEGIDIENAEFREVSTRNPNDKELSGTVIIDCGDKGTLLFNNYNPVVDTSLYNRDDDNQKLFNDRPMYTAMKYAKAVYVVNYDGKARREFGNKVRARDNYNNEYVLKNNGYGKILNIENALKEADKLIDKLYDMQPDIKDYQDFYTGSRSLDLLDWGNSIVNKVRDEVSQRVAMGYKEDEIRKEFAKDIKDLKEFISKARDTIYTVEEIRQ